MNQYNSKWYLLGVFAFLSTLGIAQTENSAFSITGKGVGVPFATDYHALGINPANLGWDNEFDGKAVTFGISEIGMSIYSEALGKEDLRMNLTQSEFTTLTPEEQDQAVIDFAKSAIAVDIDIMWTGLHVKTQKVGGFAFTVRDRFDYYSVFGSQLAEIGIRGFQSDYFDFLVLANGDTVPNTMSNAQDTLDIVQGITNLQNAFHVSEIIDGTHLSMQWLREYNLGWGTQIYSTDDYKIYGGLGIKMFTGNAMARIDAENGKAVAFSAASPLFSIDYGSGALNNPSALPGNAASLTPVGHGFGLDLGMSVLYKDKLRFGLSLTDIGSVTWDGDLYQLNDIILTSFENPGIESFDLVSQVANLSGSNGVLDWQGAESFTTKLPTVFRAGVGWLPTNKLRLGAEVIAPANKDLSNLNKAVISFGGDWTPIPWVQLSAGFIQGGNYNFKIPAGITFRVGGGSWEAGVASRDVITFFTQTQPTISFASGFLRFRV